MIILIINFLLYFFYYIQNKKTSGTLFQVLLLMFMFVSLCSIIIWENGIYNYTYYFYINNKSISLIPFIYLFIIFLFLFNPIKKFNEQKIEVVELDNYFKINVIAYFSIILGAILLILLVLYIDYDSILANAIDIYSERQDGDLIMPKYIYSLYTLHRLLYPFMLLLAFYNLAFCQKKKIQTFALLITSILPKLLVAFILVSRGGMFFLIIEIMICYLIFNKFIKKSYKRLFLYSSIIFLLIIIPIVALITSSRFSDNDYSPFMAILKYFGESFLNFNTVFWNNIREHPFGEFKFPFIYQFFDTVHTFDSRREQYEFFANMTGTQVLLFKTIVGDLYVEYGTIIGAFVLIGISFMFNKLLQLNRKIKFSILVIFFYYYELVFVGVFDLLWHGKFLFKLILFTFALYIFLKTPLIKKK